MSMTLELFALKPDQFKKLVEQRPTLAPNFYLDETVLTKIEVASDQRIEINYLQAVRWLEKFDPTAQLKNGPLPLMANGDLDYESTYGPAFWWNPPQFKKTTANVAWKALKNLEPKLESFIEKVLENDLYVVGIIS